MFEGFALERIDLGEVTLRVRHGGAGPPVLLLHGHPRTHTTWHRVAPLLARDFTVVCPDVRGYGESTVPPDEPDHAQQSKRAVARDAVALMRALGHERFAVVGHDRGAYGAFRTALDHPAAVSHLVALDAVPIGDALARVDARFARAWWHWFFFGQTAKPAERVILADPDAWYGYTAENLGAENHADYRRAIHDPATVHAMMEDYRAGLGPDRDADEADRAAGRTIACPTLVLWASRDDLADLYGDPLEVWRPWAPDLRGGPIESGHHLAEEAPDALAGELRRFLLAGSAAGASTSPPDRPARARAPGDTMPDVDDLTQAWTDAAARLPAGWSLDSLRCASTGLAVEERSEDWIAVAVNEDGSERQFRGSDPVAALDGLATALSR